MARSLPVAMADPANLLALDELQGLFGMPVQGVAVPRQELTGAVNRLYAQDVGLGPGCGGRAGRGRPLHHRHRTSTSRRTSST